MLLELEFAVVVVVVVVEELVVGRRGLLMWRVVRVGRRRCLWVALPGRRRALVLCRMDFAVRRVVMVGQKQTEKGHRTGSLVAEGRCLIQLQKGLTAAESVRLLLRQKDWVCLQLHQMLKAVQSL